VSWNEASYYTLLTNSYIFKLGNYSMAVGFIGSATKAAYSVSLL
jgi:hypothetical protein